jgi:hypothetical protein
MVGSFGFTVVLFLLQLHIILFYYKYMVFYFFCKLLGIVRYKYFLVFDDGSKKQIRIKNNMDYIIFNGDDKIYEVMSVTSEIINYTLIYQWLRVVEKK